MAATCAFNAANSCSFAMRTPPPDVKIHPHATILLSYTMNRL
jgi:hypothetical protein